jgi:hypothetical protein
MATAPCPFGASHLVHLDDFHGCLLAMLQADPSALLTKH